MMRFILVAVAACLTAPGQAQSAREPVIDMRFVDRDISTKEQGSGPVMDEGAFEEV